MCEQRISQLTLNESEITKFFEKLEEKLQTQIHHKRYVHTKGVEYTAVSMAMKYGYESGLRGESFQNFLNRVRIAGLLHDNAKCLSDEQFISECDRLQIPISEFERNHAYLLHGKVGAAYLSERFGIQDDEIANAITYHTTGRPNMSLMEKIIFIADYIEPGRTKQLDLDLIRYLAMTDLDTCIFKISEDTLNYLSHSSYEIDEMTVKTRDYYKTLAKEALLKG